MNASKWEKLRKNITLLQTEVDAECVLIPYLTENDVLEIGCRTEFEGLTNERQIDHLLLKLKGLPEDKDAYEHFLKGLRTSGFDDYSKIADDIDATETKSDSSLYAKVSPAHHSRKVQRVLNAHFTNIEGRTTSLLQVQAVLKNNIEFGRASWSNEELIAFVCQLFAGVEIVKKQDFLKTRTDIFFKHLAKIDHKDEGQTPQASHRSKDQDVNISSLTASQLASFFRGVFEKEGMSVESLSEMEKQDINGKVLLDLSEDDLKTEIPSLTVGQRRIMKMTLDDYRIKIGAKKKLERFRPFDKDIEPSNWYVLGNIVDTKIQTRGTKLAPIRNFHLPEHISDNEIRQYIVIQCAIFAAACINERQNGTIYFGIAPDETGGREKGQIEGILLLLGDLDDRLVSLFFPSQEHIIRNALRNAKYVPVFKDDKCSALASERYVIEFDVVPASCLKEEEYIRINAKDLPNPIENYKTTEPVFTFSEHGFPKVLSPAEICSNTKVPSSTIKKRGNDEYVELHNPKRVDCITRLRNHLTGGSNKMEDDIYKVLLLSSIGKSSIDVKSLDFIRNLDPEVVFDFDSRGDQGVFHALEEQEEVLKVVALDDFDEKKKGKKGVKLIKTELTKSHYLHWVFCNDLEQVNAIKWNKKRRPAFRKAFNHYQENCHRDRLLIIICLFSHNDILVEACDEILTDLSDQWILLSEQMSDAEMWQETFKSRNRVDRDDLKHRCIIGLTWEQVNNCISTWCMNDNSTFGCQIPHSSGTNVKVEKRKLNEWNDVEVLSSLDPVFSDEKTFKDKKMQVESEFHRGEQAQWLNFFSKHVCQRHIHEDLLTLVSLSLEGRCIEDDNKVLPVYLFHEPGAGGSTSAREVLWSLRKRYRCCVMKRFTDQTVDQLIEIFSFKEKSFPEPLLILIDIEDENQIIINLEEKLRSSSVNCRTFCVLLICYRTVTVPLEKRKLSMVTLQHFLLDNERSWFETRYKDLIGRHNPKSLISFNILKANFKKSVIEKTVRELVQDINDENEVTILKFVSLINTFDLDFKPIHVSCFDVILKSIGSESRSALSTSMLGGRKTRWEANVSQGFKILLNLNYHKTRTTVRVFHKLIAEHILNAIITKTGESESELIHCLLTDDIFGEDGKEMKHFQIVIANMVKKRATHEDSAKKDKFSPLILSVRKKEGTDKAVEIMETLYSLLNDDPFTAQQIARFYIDCKMFEEAEKYAKVATSKMPDISSFVNTYAQVFKAQLLEEIQQRSIPRSTQFTESEFKNLVSLCMKCTDLFKKEQTLSELGSCNNEEAGYFGELESIKHIIEAFQNCECFSRSTAKLISHKYLVNEDCSYNKLEFLNPHESAFLKSLWANSKEVLSILDDRYLQMKEEYAIDPISPRNQTELKLRNLKGYMSEFFGESCLTIPTNLKGQALCRHRSGIVFSKQANTLSGALDLKHSHKLNELNDCYSLLMENVKSKYVTLEDLKTMLGITTVLLLDGPIPRSLKFEDMINWVEQFYRNSLLKNGGKPHLEAFLYFFLYNFPTKERLRCHLLAPAPDLPSVLEFWTKTFNESMFHTITHRATTLFFLGKGQPLQDIVYQQKLHRYVVEKEGRFTWDSKIFCDILRPMEGILMPTGDYINFTDKRNKSDHEIRIKTAHKITKDFMWRNTVYFYLGFSFSGLKAYGVTNVDPRK